MADTYENKAYVPEYGIDENDNSAGGGKKHVDSEKQANRMDGLSNEEKKIMKRGIMKNVIIISIAFMLLFTAFQSMAQLQSSINEQEGLGTASLSVIYASLVISCMFVPTFLIKKLTVKWAMVVSMFCYTAYIGAQFYPHFGTLIPGAIILGMGAAPMWSAKCTYLSQVGGIYGEITQEPVEPIIVRFFGIFFLFFQSSSIWGNLISSSVLGKGKGNCNVTVDFEAISEYCGVQYCPDYWGGKFAYKEAEKDQCPKEENKEQDILRLYLLAGIFLACSVAAAAIVAFLVDPLSKYGESDRDKNKGKQGGLQLVAATFKHMFERRGYQLMIIPLTFWSGVEQGFFGADFTAGYLACAWGAHHIGYVLIVYGVVDAVCSASFGNLIQYVGRIPIFIGGAIINIICVIILFVWIPNPEQNYLFFIIAALWGAADAVWQTQINALYGVLFENAEEAAFSNYRLWESLGFIFAYLLQIYVCVYVKLWIVLIVLGVGIAGYLCIEILEKRKNRTAVVTPITS